MVALNRVKAKKADQQANKTSQKRKNYALINMICKT